MDVAFHHCMRERDNLMGRRGDRIGNKDWRRNNVKSILILAVI